MKQRQITVDKGKKIRNGEYYASCPNCVRHPRYNQQPVTLHIGDICQVCYHST